MGSDALKAAQTPCASVTTEAYYTVQAAAHELNVSVSDLEHAIADGHLPLVHKFGRKLIALDALAAYRVRRSGQS